MEDALIIDLYFRRSEQAIAETATKYGAYCRTIAFNVLHSDWDAEESVNDTYLAAWEAMPPTRPNILSLFLGKITRRLSIDRYRRTHAEKRGGHEAALPLDELAECVGEEQSVERELELRELSQTVRTFVAKLPKKERDVFLCRYFYFADIDEIAGKFHMPAGTVKSLLSRTRKKLRGQLIKEGYHDPL